MDRRFIARDTTDHADQSRPAPIGRIVLRSSVALSAAIVLTLGASLTSLSSELLPRPASVPVAKGAKSPAKSKKAVVPFVMLPSNHMLV